MNNEYLKGALDEIQDLKYALAEVEELCEIYLAGDSEHVCFSDLAIKALGNGVNPSAILRHAAVRGNIYVCNMALKCGANVYNVSSRGKTALHYASDRGHAEVCRLLLDNGTAINAKDNDGRTALHCAAAKGRVEVCELLLSYGAYRDIENKWGSTPFGEARENNHGSVCKVLQNKKFKFSDLWTWLIR